MKLDVLSTNKHIILSKDRFNFRKNTLIFGDLITDYNMVINMGSETLLGIAFLSPDLIS
jgi:hypothetical protein